MGPHGEVLAFVVVVGRRFVRVGDQQSNATRGGGERGRTNLPTVKDQLEVQVEMERRDEVQAAGQGCEHGERHVRPSDNGELLEPIVHPGGLTKVPLGEGRLSLGKDRELA